VLPKFQTTESIGTANQPIIVGEGREAQKIRIFAQRASGINETILLGGETGTGKDLLSEYIYSLGNYKGPFVTVDCGALTESLLSSELFGHVRGAFTDAREKFGLIQMASDGILFLDEIGSMPLTLQAHILRVVERKPYRMVGGTKELPITARIIAATNENLMAAVKEGRFRRDLYYRLNVLSFTMPRLHERREDIPLLVKHFLKARKEKQGEDGCGCKIFSPEAVTKLQEYSWPGNIRELSNVVSQAVFYSDHDSIGPDDIRFNDPENSSVDDYTSISTFKDCKRQYYLQLYKHSNGNATSAAEISEISYRSLLPIFRNIKVGIALKK
jgi:transcriptional regulator with PAS, ATPase and Fis domain